VSHLNLAFPLDVNIPTPLLAADLVRMPTLTPVLVNKCLMALVGAKVVNKVTSKVFDAVSFPYTLRHMLMVGLGGCGGIFSVGFGVEEPTE
jgi:hypothetical protein